MLYNDYSNKIITDSQRKNNQSLFHLCKAILFIICTVLSLSGDLILAQENSIEKKDKHYDNYYESDNIDYSEENHYEIDDISHYSEINDPFESSNRRIYLLNKRLDKNIFIPTTKLYHKLIKSPKARSGISNFFSNLKEPLYALNALLQMKMDIFLTATTRFILNSSIGIAGFSDIAAKKFGIKQIPSSSSDVLLFYGFNHGNYVVLPFFGPSTIREGIGTFIDYYTDPIDYTLRNHSKHKNTIYYKLTLEMISERSDLISLSKEIDEISLDEYALMRTLYAQNLKQKEQQKRYFLYQKKKQKRIKNKKIFRDQNKK